MSRNVHYLFDALVIGAGAGGVCAAARLAQAGYRTLLVEALDQLGGHASTREVDGFLLNTGAGVFERDGAVAQLFQDLGLGLDLWAPDPVATLLWGREETPVLRGEGLARVMRVAVPGLVDLFCRLEPVLRPRPGQVTSDWLTRFTGSERVHNLVDNLCGAFFAASASELPADIFLHCVMSGDAFTNIGYPAGGAVEVWKALAGYIEAHGGAVWLGSLVRLLVFGADGLVAGAEVVRNGEPVQVSARVVISNVGPHNTVRLAEPGRFAADYIQAVEDRADGGATITVHFASPAPFVTWAGLAFAGSSRRLIHAANYSAPEQGHILRQGRWHLYSGTAMPRPACGPFDLELEKQLLIADLQDYFPGLDEAAMILATDVAAHGWPAQRAVPGYDLPIQTPIANLWNVGDGVKAWAEAGTSACARTADLAAKAAVAFMLSR